MAIASSAEPFHADAAPGDDGQRVGVLLCHGFTGSPASMVPWGHHLAAQGLGVEVPLLPGHGTRWQDLNRTGTEDWYAEVGRAFDKLRANCDQVVVGGLSMGGYLALRLAVEHGRDVAGVMLVNPAVQDARPLTRALPLLKLAVPSTAGITDDIKKPGVTEHGYDRTPLRAAHALLRGFAALQHDLPLVTQPLLVWRSRVDHVVDGASTHTVLTRVSSRDLEERVLEDSYHVATLDYDAPRIFAESVDFVRRVTAP